MLFSYILQTPYNSVSLHVCKYNFSLVLNMTLFELRNTFYKELKLIYPQSEIESIFYLLVQDLFGLDQATLILEGNNEFPESQTKTLIKALDRLKKNEPVQHIIGRSTFYGFDFKVNTDVLIPRPETEELVDWIIEDFKNKNLNKKVSILDIGTGSGCIAISLAKNIPNAEVWAMDISDKALTIAKENAKTNKVEINVIQEDILNTKTLPQNFDIIVSNPPYVRLQEKKMMQKNVTDFDPEKALFVTDENPLIFYDKIAELALDHLNNKGILYFEINQYLGKETVELLQNKGFKDVILRKDLLGNNRMIRSKK